MADLPTVLAPLVAEPRWVTWRWAVRPNGKPDKPLFCAYAPNRFASTSDPTTWAPYRVAAALKDASAVDGIGYVLRDDAERIYFDLDHCRNPTTGEIADWAMRIVEEADTYTEITPSGCGLRVIGSNEWIVGQIHKQLKIAEGGPGAQVEVYYQATRYITVTGNQLDGTPDVIRPISDLAAELLSRIGAEPSSSGHMPATGKPNDEAAGALIDIQSALQTIKNDDLSWDDWSRVGMATWRASGGSPEALEAWRDWSAKSPKHDDGACNARWKHWFTSPPSRLGFGTLYYMARLENPLWAAPTRRGVVVETISHDVAAEHVATPNTKAKPKSRLLHLEDVESLPPPEWLVDKLVPEKGLVVPYGPPKIGKTFLVLSIALHIAAGKDWFGHKVKQGSVIYIAGEGVGGFPVRLKAMRAGYGIGSNVPFWVLPGIVNFREPDAAERLVAEIREAIGDEPIALIVVDTLARAMPGVDENSAQEIGLVIATCDAVKAAMGCTVMPVHHTGKDTSLGMRGSSAIHGAVDATFMVKDAGSGRISFINDNQKEAEPAEAMVFEMEQVMVGLRSSLVPKLLDGVAAPTEGSVDYSDIRARIANLIGPSGRMTMQRVCQGLGMAVGGRSYARIADAIPLAPDGLDLDINGAKCRLWMARSGSHNTAPMEVVRHDF